MKTDNGKKRERFPWLRAARDRITRETAGMTPEEWVDYTNARFLEAQKIILKFTPEEAERIVLDADYEEKLIPARRVKIARRTATPLRKAKATIKTSAQRRKATRQLAHA